jgi:peptidyl-prolyl cis-trans isomerase D
MISILRAFTKSWIFQGILVLLIASFAIYGLRDVFGSHPTNAVITAGSRTFSDQDFKRDFENYKRSYTEQNQGQTFSPDDFVAAGQHLAMVDQLADQVGLSAWLDQIGVTPSKQLIGQQVAKGQAFINPVTGRVDKETYVKVLAENGMDPATFERDLSDQIATAQYGDAALAGLKAPRIAAAVEAAFATQTRDASYFVLSPDTVAKPGTPSDADLQAFYKAHTKDLTIPELRTAVMVKFNPADIAPTIPADEDALKKAYEAQKSTLGTPEQRTFVEVTAPNAGAANAISAALKAGKSPDAAAAANGGKVIAYQAKAQADVPDAKIAAAAFALKAGDVSGPVSGDLGMGVVKVTDVKPGSAPTFEAARAKLLADYQQAKAADKINQIVNDFQKAHDSGEPFDTTVQKMGLKVVPLQPMTAQGRTANPQVDYSRFPKVVQDVYSLQVGQSSDVEEFGNGQYFAVKLVSDKPAGPPPFDQMKPQLAQFWTMDKEATAIGAAADQAMARLNAGEKLEKVAADLHVTVQTATGVDRGDSAKKLNNQMLTGHIFMAKPGETFQAAADRLHIAVGRLDAIHQTTPAAAAAAAAAIRPQFTNSMAEDLGTVTRKAARAAMKTKTYPDVAVRAIGVTPADQSSSSKAKS